MPKLFEVLGYSVYFWSNENNEPIHIHISKKRASENSTKLWLLSDGTWLIASNASKIPSRDIADILEIIDKYKTDILGAWLARFNTVRFYK